LQDLHLPSLPMTWPDENALESEEVL